MTMRRWSMFFCVLLLPGCKLVFPYPDLPGTDDPNSSDGRIDQRAPLSDGRIDQRAPLIDTGGDVDRDEGIHGDSGAPVDPLSCMTPHVEVDFCLRQCNHPSGMVNIQCSFFGDLNCTCYGPLLIEEMGHCTIVGDFSEDFCIKASTVECCEEST